MNAIIIDDEIQAISALKSEITKFDDVEIIGTAQSIKEALPLLEKSTPDILFLDIQLSDGTGFDLLNQLSSIDESMHIIFTTAYNQYAMESFKFNTVDYILKPIDLEDLERAINKVRSKPKLQSEIDMLSIRQVFQSMWSNTQVPLQTEGEIRIVQARDIVRIQANGNYSRFYFSNGMKPLMIARTMKEYELKLSKIGFIRPHLSHIVNENHIKSYFSKDGGYLVLTDGTNIPISQRKRQAVLSKLKGLL